MCVIETTKKTYEFKTHELLIVNGSYYGGQRIDHHTSVYKDYLTIIALGTDESRLKYAANHLRLLLGRQNRSDTHPFSISVREATITTKPRRLIHTDGEVISKTPAAFAINHKAITVFVP